MSPNREPNAPATEPAPVLVTREKPSPLHPIAAHDVPKQKDITVQQEKIIQEPLVASKTPTKAPEKEKAKKKEKEKDKEKEKEKEKDHKDKKDKEMEKDHKEKKDKDKVKEGSQLHKELKAGVADMVHKLSSTAPSSGGGHERAGSAAAGTTIITLAGENKGASMKVDSSAVADGRGDAAGSKERRGHKLDGSVVVSGKEHAGGGKGLTAFVNSNVQVINNSLMLQSSCNGGDPGVHLKLSTKAKKKDGEEASGGKSGSAAAPKK
jgi:hypothetical protein